MPTLRSRSVVTDTSPAVSGHACVAAASPNDNKKTSLAPGAAPLSVLSTVSASSLHPVTPAGDGEHSLPPISPRTQQQQQQQQRRGGGGGRRKGVEKKLQFAEQQHDGVAESVVRRSKRFRGGGIGVEAVSRKAAEAAVAVAETMATMTMVDKGKRKLVDAILESEDDSSYNHSTSDEENEVNDTILQGAGSGTFHTPTRGRAGGRNGEGRGIGRASRSLRGGARPRSVNMEPDIAASAEDVFDLAALVQENGLEAGPSRSNKRGVSNGNVVEATKAKFLEIARRRAAHFAHFTGEEDEPTVPAADVASGKSIEEQKTRAAELLSRVSAGVVRPDDGEQGAWPGPFIIARQLVEGRAAAAEARQDSTRLAGEKPKPSVEWAPSRRPHFRKDRVATSLHDMCVEVLCANIGHVESLVGVPDATKTRISARLCAQRNMTPAAVRLLFESQPAEVVVPDFSFVTEESLTEAIGCCSTEQLQVLELGMCGRGLSDQLCTTALAGFSSSLPILNTLTLNGAYRLTDIGLKALVHAAPNLITLNLSQCNMISATGIQTVADCIGPTLKALYLEACSQLDALKVLPSLLKMSSLQSLSLSGISGISDGIMSELAVILGPNLRELAVAECRALTDAAIGAVSLCCSRLTLLDLGHMPLLTDVAIGSLADGCRSLKTLRLNRGKFSDTAIAALVMASGNCLRELSLNSVRQAGDCTLSALAKHSNGTLEQLDLSFCRTVTDEGLGLLADSCSGLREIRLFGCTQVTNLFLEGHSNPVLNVIGLQNDTPNVTRVTGKANKKSLHQGGSVVCPSQVCS